MVLQKHAILTQIFVLFSEEFKSLIVDDLPSYKILKESSILLFDFSFIFS